MTIYMDLAITGERLIYRLLLGVVLLVVFQDELIAWVV